MQLSSGERVDGQLGLANHEIAQLFEQRYELMLGWVIVKIGNVAIAEDIVSDAFESAIKAAPRFIGTNVDAEGWLFKIIENKVKDHWRKHANRLVVYIDNMNAEYSPLAATNDYTDYEIAMRETYKTLNAKERVVLSLMLLYETGELFDAVSRELSITSTNARVRVFRVKSKLRTTLKRILQPQLSLGVVLQLRLPEVPPKDLSIPTLYQDSQEPLDVRMSL